MFVHKIHVSIYRQSRKGSKISGAFALKQLETVSPFLKSVGGFAEVRQDEIWVRRWKHAEKSPFSPLK